MEWDLAEDKKSMYASLVKSAQDVESTIGQTFYRIHKLTLMREEVDRGLKQWWESIIKDMGLDTKRDYMVTADGKLQEVFKPGAQRPAVEEVETILPKTVSDLK